MPSTFTPACILPFTFSNLMASDGISMATATRAVCGRVEERGARVGAAMVPAAGAAARLSSVFSMGLPASASRDLTLQRSEEHTSELQSLRHLVCRLLLEKKK